jgi:hypothetical protein
MHINRHHHAVSLCGEEISKGKLGSAIVTMDACNSEKLSDLNIEPPDDIERIEKKKKNYAGSENHSPHQLRKRSHFGTEYRKAPPPRIERHISF